LLLLMLVPLVVVVGMLCEWMDGLEGVRWTLMRMVRAEGEPDPDPDPDPDPAPEPEPEPVT
jgi:hypothetical protein